ncbi:hypothetical protein EV1_040048 [Malus domestica]
MKKGRTMKKGRAMKKGNDLTFIQSLSDERLLEILTKRSPRVIKHQRTSTVQSWCAMGDEKEIGLSFLHSLNCQKLVNAIECRERARQLFWSILVEMEVRGRIIKLHKDSAAAKACNDCGSAQGLFTVRPPWDY